MQPRSAWLPETLRWPGPTHTTAGCLRHLWETCVPFGPVGLLVHGASLQKSGRLATLLKRTPQGMRVVPHQHEGGEPTLPQLDSLRSTAHAARVQWVAAIGGGSVLDLGKAVAGLLHAPESSQAYHDGAEIPATGVPFLAVPTTAGTGSEATTVCVLTHPDTGVKKSFRHPALLARGVFLDPTLLEEAPRAVIAASGMDALTQALESFVSRHATPFTRSLSLQAFTHISQALLPVYQGRRSDCADLLQGSYLAGVALEHARLGLVHGLAHPLGARYDLPHGVTCAACLPVVLRFNREHDAASLRELESIVNAPLADWIDETRRQLRMTSPFPATLPEDLDRIIAEVLASGSTKANPRPVTAGDVRHLLHELFHPHP